VLSPDERKIALIARNGAIWIHELASGKWTAMKTETMKGAVIWSPDGRSIAYVSNSGNLYALDLTSGASRRIAELGQIGDGASGIWCQSDTILVNKDRTSGLVSVPAAGGAATPLVEPNSAKGELGYARPQCLPSGKIAVFVRMGSANMLTRSGDATTLALPSNPDLPGVWTLLDERHGFLINDGTLLYQAFDTEHRPIGEPEVVVRDVSIGEGFPLVSAGNHAIELSIDRGENQRQFAWFDRTEGKSVWWIPLAVPEIRNYLLTVSSGVRDLSGIHLQARR
jgi:hypothetical protein